MRQFARGRAPALGVPVPALLPHLVGCFLGLCLLACPASIRADSVVVFNEVMYHPSTNEAALEWVELHNQMAVDVDLSGWSISDAIQYTFPKDTVIPGRGYLVVGSSPSDLREATGLTNVLGPFSGRLSNSGETLELRNNNNRLMDEVSYSVDGDWPVAADGSGVSLAKRAEDAASPVAENWTVSALIEGTPGRGNFASSVETNTTRAALFASVWKYEASGADLGTGWRERGFDDAAWPEGQALFQAGEVTVPPGEIRPIPGLFSTGVDENGAVLSAGSADPHYWLTLSANGTPPPPLVSATVIQNHPAWVANNSESSWIGPVNPGTTSAAPGNYHYRTQFTLNGLDPSSVVLTFTVGADDSLADVVLNGVSKGISYTGFSSWSSPYSLTSGFVSGTNTLDFLTLNGGTSETPVGLRLNLAGLAREQSDSRTTLPAGRTNYYFRKSFEHHGAPGQTAVRLNAIVADGAVFYLNGTEVLRWNLPPGPVSAGTLAISNVPGPLVLGPFDLPNSALRTGNNVLAVEVHSAAGGQTNVLFGAGVTLITTNGALPPSLTIAFNEMSASTNEEGWLELINFGVEAVDISGCVLARHGATDNQYMFPAQQIAAGAHFVVPESLLGGSLASGDRVFCYAPGGSRVLDAVVIRNELRGRWPDGLGSWWFPVAATPGSSNQFAFHDEVVINEVMYHPPIRPAAPAIYGTNRLVSITNTWRYYGQGLEPGPSWIAPGYDDQDWLVGSALFYHTTSLLPAPKLTPLSLVDSEGARIITWYFRTAFDFGAETNRAELTLKPIVDDGAVYYLNGVEIYRQNMPSGVPRYDTLASMGVATPAFSGPFTVPVTNLVAGTNVLAVEVHQFTTNPIAADMAFGVEVSIYDQLAPATLATEPPGAWLELYNRSTNAVDLTGWRLDEGIDFRFPPGTVIAADNYLVVAEDVAYVRSNYPGITVVGPFNNRLSHASDRLTLKDAANNPADEVTYFDGRPWPEYADGGGSSLELRDPWADNAKAESWAASNEAGRSRWNQYTYRGIARNVLGPTLWSEFVTGLLDAGECLIDDLRVIESPETAPADLLQNGSFETGLTAWRALGTHGSSRVVVDPDNPANHVLHLRSTGPTDHMHNHLETTLAGGKTVSDGREYEVSFRAKWLTGNNRLNTRLYFNRAAKTIPLERPAALGSPGSRNSVYNGNIGPTFDVMRHSPVLPGPNEPVTISVAISDPQGVGLATLHWRLDGGSWQSTPMGLGGPSGQPGYRACSASVPGQVAGTLVQFFLEAVDSSGVSSFFPADGPNSRAFFKVNEGKPVNPGLHRFRLLMASADTALLHASTNVMSNDLLGLTIVYNDREVYYDTGMHLQRSQRGRNDPSQAGFAVRFPADHLFRGVQKNVTLDRSGGSSGRGGRHDEILLWHAISHAGGLLGLDCDLVQVFAPRSQEDGTAMMRLSAFDNDYFGNQFPDGDKGARYRLELIYYPTTSLGGDPQSPKLPQPDEVLNVDFTDWGADQENYRWIFLQENQADLDDYGQVMALNRAFALTGPEQVAELARLMDVDQWIRSLAFKAFTGDEDTYTTSLNHNWKIYFRPGDGRVMGMLWDEDLSFKRPVNDAFPGSSSANTTRLLLHPNNFRCYYNHLLDLLTTTVNAEHLEPWAARYAGLLGQDWTGVVTYLQQRADFIRSRLPATVPFAITSHGGANFAVTNAYVELQGAAPLQVKDIEINGLVYGLTWSSLSNWALRVPLPQFVNVLAAQGVDNRGNALVEAMDSIIVTNLGALAPVPVVINEWMADNAGPGGFFDPADGLYQDWVELYNPNAVAVDLSSYYLTDSLSEPNKWQLPDNTMIGPRGFLLVWADGNTGQNGWGGTNDLHADFQLSRSGETIALFSPQGTQQDAVTFGAQTQNVSQGLYPDGQTGAVFALADWSPRGPNRVGDVALPHVSGAAWKTGGVIELQTSAIPGRTYRLEFKNTLEATAWTVLGAHIVAAGPTIVFQDAPGPNLERYYRIVLVR